MTTQTMTRMMDIHQIIRPLIVATYGNTDTARACASHLAGRINSFHPDDVSSRHGRQGLVQRIFWADFGVDAFAETTAEKIESALQAAGL